MIEIAKITLDGYFNYGNVLQNYALNTWLKNHGFHVQTIWHTDNQLLQNKCHKWSSKDFRRTLLSPKYRRNLRNGSYQWEIIRQAYMKKFCDQYIDIQYDLPLEDIDTLYDYVIVGSDQVWNPGFEKYDIAFLRFVPQGKRIAYAASFGMASLPQTCRERFAKAICEMAAVSVREEQGAAIIKELTGKNVPVVLDPTLLLDAEEWTELESKPAWYKNNNAEKYILTYFLGKKPPIIETVAEKEHLKVINLLDMAVFDHYTVSPQEFLYLIHHAALVYTDSFHGSVFSILFERPFVVCDRIDKHQYSMKSRIDTLLKLFCLQDRMALQENSFEISHPCSITWPDSNENFRQMKEQSQSFLLDMLK